MKKQLSGGKWEKKGHRPLSSTDDEEDENCVIWMSVKESPSEDAEAIKDKDQLEVNGALTEVNSVWKTAVQIRSTTLHSK